MRNIPDELLNRAVALLQLCDAWIPRHATYHSRLQELYDVVVALQSLPELPAVETHRSRPKALPDGVEIGSRVVAKNPRGGIMHGWYQGYDPYTDGVNPHIIRRGEDDGIYRCHKVAPFGSSLMPEDSSPAPVAETCEWDFRGVEFHGGANAGCRKKVRAFAGECSYDSAMKFCPYCGKTITIKSGRE